MSNSIRNPSTFDGATSSTPFTTTFSHLVTFNRTCNSTIECKQEAGLVCLSQQCRCNSSNAYILLCSEIVKKNFFFFNGFLIIFKRYWASKANRCVECLDGWMAYENVCWKLFIDHAMSWPDALVECRNHSAELITLDNDEKFAMIGDRLREMEILNVWVYSRRRDKKFKFTWLSNEKPISSSYWGQKAVNSSSNLCVAMSKSTQFKLDDVDCATLSHFICEY